jgi:undecaprenyl-diphosphatase
MIHQLILRADAAERRLCLLANSAARRSAVRRVFKVVSRLGDGVFWYALIVLMPLFRGAEGIAIGLKMLFTGSVGLALYKYLKTRFVRERPFVRLVGIECVTPPLDQYSFPSGHTLHAVCFTMMAVWHVPGLLVVLLPFTALVAASRVVLGLHYPSDVLVGATLGGALAIASNLLMPLN